MKTMLIDKTARDLTDKLQNNIPTLMGKYNVPGLSLALVSDGDIYWDHPFGVKSNIT